MMWRRISRRGVAIGLVFLLGACATGPAETPRARETGPVGDRLELSAKPLWRGDDGGLPDVMRGGFGSARFVGGLLLLEWDRDTTAVVDPDTGMPVWTTDPRLRFGTTAKGAELWHPGGRAPVAQVAGEDVLFTDYIPASGEPPEVAAVRLRDAGPLWSVPEPSDAVDADDRLVLLGGDGPVARALDSATGATRWDARGLWPRFVAGDRVLAEVGSQAPDLDAADSAVVGLDATSGRRVWSLADRYARSEVELVAGDVALVYAHPADADTDRDVAVVIDVSTGAEITRLGWDWGARSTCATGGTLIACILDERLGRHVGESTSMVTFDVRNRTSHPAVTDDLAGAAVRAVWGDYLFVDDHQATWAVDRNGTRMSDDLPGELLGIDDNHAVVRLPGEVPVIATYTVR